MLFNKPLLYILTGPDQPAQLIHLLASTSKICILPGHDLRLQVFRHVPQILYRLLKRPKQIGRSRNTLFRGNQSHMCILTSCVSDPRTRKMKSGPQGCPHDRLPTSSSLIQPIRETVRKVKHSTERCLT